MLLHNTFLHDSLILGDILGHAQMGEEKLALIIMTSVKKQSNTIQPMLNINEA